MSEKFMTDEDLTAVMGLNQTPTCDIAVHDELSIVGEDYLSNESFSENYSDSFMDDSSVIVQITGA